MTIVNMYQVFLMFFYILCFTCFGSFHPYGNLEGDDPLITPILQTITLRLFGRLYVLEHRVSERAGFLI